MFGELPQPVPGAGEVLIEVHATAITPLATTPENSWLRTIGNGRGLPLAVLNVGNGVTDLKPGDAVFGMSDWFANGAEAEFCVAPPAAMALKPQALDHAHTAVVPMAVQALANLRLQQTRRSPISIAPSSSPRSRSPSPRSYS